MSKKISYSFVIADLFHYGHLRVLEKAKNMSDYHICGVLSDKVCSEWQGKNLCSLEERIEVIKSCKYVDKVMTQDSINPENNLKKILNKYKNCTITVFHGDDWSILPGQTFMDKHNIKTKLISHYKKLSRELIYNHFSMTNNDTQDNIHDYQFNNYKNLFETKGQTLITLDKYLNESIIEEIFTFQVNDFINNKKKIINQIKKKFNKTIIIRSSTKKEDSMTSSHAGEFLTVQNVCIDNDNLLSMSINQVIDRYKEKMKLYMNEEILVQEQSSDIKTSGVVFTRGLKTNSPYYVITYDDQSGKTDTVTSGKTCNTIWLYRDVNRYRCPSKWKKLLSSIIEIEKLFKSMVLDIEFAISKNNDVIIYQVRPLATNVKYSRMISNEFMENSIRKYDELKKQNATIFSDMTFWNPSELIGENPKPLSYSIFNDIFMKKNWNIGLEEIGYSKVNKGLMHKFGNKPYINVESVIEALLPNDINMNLKTKLKIFYKDRFLSNLINHDKFEFQIMPGTIIIDKDLSSSLRKYLTKSQYSTYIKSLSLLTKSIIDNFPTYKSNYINDLKKCSQKKPIDIDGSHLNLISFIKQNLDDLKEYATSQFSAAARMAFISKYIIDYSVLDNLMTKNDSVCFYNSLNTIVTQYTSDLNKLSVSKINKKYNHMRSGTYSLLSPKFKLSNKVNVRKQDSRKKLNRRDFIKKLSYISEKYNLDCSVDKLYEFLIESIKLREYLKFNFSKTISSTLDLIEALARYLKIDVKDMEYIDIEILLAGLSYPNKTECANMFQNHIKSQIDCFKNNDNHTHNECITSLKDLFIIEHKTSKPNFITEEITSGKIKKIDKNCDTSINLSDYIVLIDSADPGFDWIFASKIKGLITKYGGMGSHMAIRCAELNIPAAIGCGHKLFDSIHCAPFLTLNCYEGKISTDSKYEIFN